MFRLTSRGVLTVLTHDLEAPNGLALSPDETRLFVSESKPELAAWYVFDVAPNGTLTKKRRLLDALPWAAARQGAPDGLKVDDSGNIFAAGPGGVYVIDPGGPLVPAGTLLGVIETGVAHVQYRMGRRRDHPLYHCWHSDLPDQDDDAGAGW